MVLSSIQLQKVSRNPVIPLDSMLCTTFCFVCFHRPAFCRVCVHAMDFVSAHKQINQIWPRTWVL